MDLVENIGKSKSSNKKDDNNFIPVTFKGCSINCKNLA